MAGTKGMSWKWKILIALLILVMIVLGFIFSPPGMVMMQEKIREAYNECPADQRLTHESADWWLLLAWWEGTICQRDMEARVMYQEFLGIKPTSDVPFKDTHRDTGELKWNGFFNPKADKKNPGWGILHERAPEAYYQYLVLYQPRESAQFTTYETEFYYDFYKIYPQFTKSTKPHPKFYKYWEKLKAPSFLDPRFVSKQMPVAPIPDGFEGPIQD